MNLRQHVTQTKNNSNILELLKSKKIYRLTPKIIEYLEYLVPLKLDNTPFNRKGWDCTDTRKQLLQLCLDEIISSNIMNMETRRRRKKKIG